MGFLRRLRTLTKTPLKVGDANASRGKIPPKADIGIGMFQACVLISVVVIARQALIRRPAARRCTRATLPEKAYNLLI